MNIADSLNEEELTRLARGTIKVGDVYEITMTKENGLTPKSGDLTRNKYFVILGFDADGNVYGGVIINSNINKNLPGYIKIYHMPIRKAKYDFLRYDSFVDCLQLKIARVEKFKEWDYLGELDSYDVELIIGTIKESPRESAAHLAQFGL